MRKVNYISVSLTAILLSMHYFSCNSVEPDSGDGSRIGIEDVILQTWTIFNTENSEIHDNEIKALAFDSFNNLWVGSFNNGVSMFNGSSWFYYDTSNSGLSDNSIQCIMADEENIWIGTSNGLTKYDGKSWTVYNTFNSPLPYKVISALAVDKNNKLWIGCGHFSAGGIMAFNGANWEIYTTNNSSLPSSIINVIYVDAKNNKWIGTGNGIVRIDNQNSWKVYTKNNSGVLFNGINAIATDPENNVWIGANELARLEIGHYFGGLQKFDGKTWIDYRPHPNGKYSPEAITSNRVDHIICDRFGLILIATQTEGKYPYNLSFFKNGAWKNISDMAEDFPLNLFIRDIIIDKYDTVWLATQSGVISLDYASKK